MTTTPVRHSINLEKRVIHAVHAKTVEKSKQHGRHQQLGVKITVLDRNSEKVRAKANEEQSQRSESFVDQILRDLDTSEEENDVVSVKSRESKMKQTNIEPKSKNTTKNVNEDTNEKANNNDSIRESMTEIVPRAAEEHNADDKLCQKKSKQGRGRPRKNEGQFACEVVDCSYRTKNRGNLEIHCERWSHHSSQVTAPKTLRIRKRAGAKYEKYKKLHIVRNTTKDVKESTTKDGTSKSRPWFDGTRYKCGLCGRNDFKDTDNISKHIRDAHKIRDADKRRRGIFLISMSSYTCKLCEHKMVRNRLSIRQHLYHKHNLTFADYESRFKMNSEIDEEIHDAVSVVADKSMDVTGEGHTILHNQKEVMIYPDEATENQVDEAMDAEPTVDIVKSEVTSILSNSTLQENCLKISDVIGGTTY